VAKTVNAWSPLGHTTNMALTSTVPKGTRNGAILGPTGVVPRLSNCRKWIGVAVTNQTERTIEGGECE